MYRYRNGRPNFAFFNPKLNAKYSRQQVTSNLKRHWEGSGSKKGHAEIVV